MWGEEWVAARAASVDLGTLGQWLSSRCCWRVLVMASAAWQPASGSLHLTFSGQLMHSSILRWSQPTMVIKPGRHIALPLHLTCPHLPSPSLTPPPLALPQAAKHDVGRAATMHAGAIRIASDATATTAAPTDAKGKEQDALAAADAEFAARLQVSPRQHK